MWLLKVCLKIAIEALKIFKMRLDFFRKYGAYLPQGTVVNRIENIKIGKNFAISPYCQLLCQDIKGSELVIGDHVALNYNVMINADRGGKIYIGNNVMIGPQTVLRASNHKFKNIDVPICEQGCAGGTIVVEDGVWIGANVVVLPNVKIGKGSVIGAGSVVNRDISEYCVAVGVPARVIKSRRHQDLGY